MKAEYMKKHDDLNCWFNDLSLIENIEELYIEWKNKK